MYHLLKHTEHSFVIVVKPDDEYYPTYIRLGYEKVNEGTYKEMEEIQKQVVQEYLKTLSDERN